MKSISIITCWILLFGTMLAFGPAHLPEPELPLEKALELAKAYIHDKKIDVSHHYIDRIWIGFKEGQPDRRWIISWSPKPEESKEPHGWIILTVKLDGTVSDDRGAAPWIHPRMLELIKNAPPSAIEPYQTK